MSIITDKTLTLLRRNASIKIYMQHDLKFGAFKIFKHEFKEVC